VWGPNGGHWGHSTGIGPNGAWGRTTGIGPNGAVWGHGGAIGPNGAWGYAGYSGPAGHWSRNWGGWYNGYGPAWGNGRWDYLWDNYPVAMAFGATMWGINAINYAFGVGSYYNPYYDSGSGGYASYSEPIVGDPAYTETAPADAASTDATTADASASDASAAADPLTQTFDDARVAFRGEKFDEAMKLVDQALQQAPKDAAINEFRSLCLFALGRYRESAATIHAVLAAGPGWDWTTMISLYGNSGTYTTQLRALEDAVKASPKSADLQFLLAYHYITAGHKDDAVALLKSVVQLEPKDELSADLVKMYEPPAAGASAPASPTAENADSVKEPAYPLEKLEGSWTAKSKDGEFALTLNKDDSFTWKFTRDGKDQSIGGAFVVRGNNLVMQPDSGGVMLSEITLKDDKTLEFSPIGEGNKLSFKKQS
jgi:tetratricopeptide (TPR) repeat protein